MNREHLFRAKRVDNGEEVEGSLIYGNKRNPNDSIKTIECVYICWAFYDNIKYYAEVDHETVGQFTGLCDKNGKKVFEGDICGCFCNTQIFVVKYCQDRCGYFFDDCVLGGGCEPCPECLGNLRGTIEIIGNIHDNPELLEVEE